MEHKINYLSKNYDDFKKEIQSYTKKYYPNILSDFSDASIGKWFVDINAGIADELSYHIDRSFQETQIDFAQERRSLLAIARTNSLRIPGKKTSLVEVEISCEVPLGDGSLMDRDYLPIVRAGTKAIGGGKVFEFTEDVDFNSQFNKDGISNRQILPKRNSNGAIEKYIVKKLEIMSGSETKFFSKEIRDFDVKPFMEIILPETNVVSVESVVFKEGTNFKYRPNIQDFMREEEYFEGLDRKPTWRYFEVDNLVEDKMFVGNMIKDDDNLPTGESRGMWKYITQKYITEYTDKGYMKIIFGAGSDYDYPEDGTPTQKRISRIINNRQLGILPKPGWTMNIMYRVGGGYSTNIASGVLNTLTYKDVEIKGDDDIVKSSVVRSLKVTNISPSVSGRDEPSNDEIRYMIKYNNQGQERAVQLKDYIDRIYKMPSKFGSPYRVGVVEKNNIIEISVLSVDNENKLTDGVSGVLLDNISNYLSEYKMLGDYVVVKPGKVINLQVECDLIINKSYNMKNVMYEVIETIKEFFNKDKRQMGENLYTSELIRDINNVDGVLNLIELRVFNVYGSGGYSKHKTRQRVITGKWSDSGNWIKSDETETRLQIDLVDSEGVLYNDTNSMFEIKNDNLDIMLRIKTN